MYRLVTIAAAVALSAPALAQQPSQAQANAIRQACRADYQAHCMGVPTGGSEALVCLKNAQGLSAGCRRALDAVGGGTASTAPPAGKPAAAPPPAMAPMPPHDEPMPVLEACAGDYRHFCRGLPPGGGRVVACLRENADGLSRQCRRALAALRYRR
jgi:hypothetical protein